MKQPDNLAPVPRIIGLNAEDAARAIGVSKRQLFVIKDLSNQDRPTVSQGAAGYGV